MVRAISTASNIISRKFRSIISLTDGTTISRREPTVRKSLLCVSSAMSLTQSESLGGVIQQSYPSQQGFGWFGASNQFTPGQFPNNNNNNAAFPKLPTQNNYVPNYAPPAYTPFNFPYPMFPNYNQFPFVPPFNAFPGQYPAQPPSGQQPGTQTQNQHLGGQFQGQNNGDGQHQVPQKPVENFGSESGNRVEEFVGKYPTDAFFGHTQNTAEREWTQDDEMKWQATTKAPYFENKVPGLDCVLPASAVLGATTALKASNLLPLNIPVGKPILSCNATDLLQAQINIDGTIYDCKGSAITISCPRLDSRNQLDDECEGQTLKCDLRSKPESISCTNGTLISSQEIVCKSAAIMEKQNILNCLFKNRPQPVIPLPTRVPHQSTTRYRPTSKPATTVRPPAPVSETDFNVNEIDQRFSSDNKPTQHIELMNEVKTAMKTVFPHELLTMSLTKGYLPPVSNTPGQMPVELKNEMQGVFPHNLFAMSQTDDNSIEGDDDDYSRLSASSRGHVNNEASSTQNRQSEWNVNANTKKGNSGTSTKTNPIASRLGAEAEEDLNDRLIFSP